MNRQSLILFILAAAGGFIFSLLHLPLPWTLGPLVMAIVWKTVLRKQVYWPKKLRNMAMVILGFMMGSPFTPAVAQQIVQQLPIMLLTTSILITLCLVTGYLAERYTGVGLAIPYPLSPLLSACLRGVCQKWR